MTLDQLETNFAGAIYWRRRQYPQYRRYLAKWERACFLSARGNPSERRRKHWNRTADRWAVKAGLGKGTRLLYFMR
jgi:hypothetical protein